MIEAENGSLYTGITKDLARRFLEHTTSEKSAKFFRSSPAKKMVFSKAGFTYSAALIEEARIKKLSKLKKIEFLALQKRDKQKTATPKPKPKLEIKQKTKPLPKLKIKKRVAKKVPTKKEKTT
jgi:putative endonuclease